MEKCPECGAKKADRIHKGGLPADPLVHPDQHRCGDCGHVYVPPIHFTTPYVAILVGTLLICGGFFTIYLLYLDIIERNEIRGAPVGRTLLFLVGLFGGGGLLTFKAVRLLAGLDDNLNILDPLGKGAAARRMAKENSPARGKVL